MSSACFLLSSLHYTPVHMHTLLRTPTRTPTHTHTPAIFPQRPLRLLLCLAGLGRRWCFTTARKALPTQLQRRAGISSTAQGVSSDTYTRGGRLFCAISISFVSSFVDEIGQFHLECAWTPATHSQQMNNFSRCLERNRWEPAQGLPSC